MDNPVAQRSTGDHDWLSREYVDDWITRDVTRDSERRPLLRQMLALAPFARDAEISVIDVGAGYGIVSDEVLKAFPHARVTLQDYSEPMFTHSRQRLAAYADRISFALADLDEASWYTKVGGPFDMAVSGLAIHNLHKPATILAVYRAIHHLLKPGGVFLDYDLAGIVDGGVDTHLRWFKESGFERAECTWKNDQSPAAILAAWKAK